VTSEQRAKLMKAIRAYGLCSYRLGKWSEAPSTKRHKDDSKTFNRLWLDRAKAMQQVADYLDAAEDLP